LTLRKRRAAAVVVTGLCLAVPTPTVAADGIALLPGFRVKPFLTEHVEYETNVFQAPSHARDDIVSRTIPGLVIDYKGRHSLTASYRAEILRFFKLENQNAEHHLADGQIKLNFPRTFLSLRDALSVTSDPPGTELTGRVDSTTNSLGGDVEYRLTSRLSLGANHNWTHADFESSLKQLDRDEHVVGGTAFWKFVHKADLRLGYSYGWIDFDSATTRDATRHLAALGLRGDLTAKLSSTFRVGFENREPDRKSLTGFTGMTTGGDWVYRPTERTTVTLATDRSLQESTFGENLFSVTSMASLQARHRFTRKLSAIVQGRVGVSEYPTKETVDGRTKFREDTLFGWGARAEYEIQSWLEVAAEYQRSGRDSNFSLFDFVDDKFIARLTFQF